MATASDRLAIPSGIVYKDRLPWIVRLLGGRFREYAGKREFRMAWGELSFGRRGWALDLCMFSEHFSLHVHVLRINAYVPLGWMQRWHHEPAEMLDQWGATCIDGAIHWHWGSHTAITHLPWRDWVQTACDVRRPDSTWSEYVGSWEVRQVEGGKGKEPDGRQTETYPYRYVCRDGKVQTVLATIYVERRRRTLKWLRAVWPTLRELFAIDVQFSDEVGERSGSWKGGTVGCSYELRPDETPFECLRRMERDRRFER